jgi:hypothetical protein
MGQVIAGHRGESCRGTKRERKAHGTSLVAMAKLSASCQMVVVTAK